MNLGVLDESSLSSRYLHMFKTVAEFLCKSRCEKFVANHKQQCPLLQVLCDLKQNTKKVILHGDCQEFSFLYRRTLKQIKQKRSSGNVVHLFLRLSVCTRDGADDKKCIHMLHCIRKPCLHAAPHRIQTQLSSRCTASHRKLNIL